MESMFYTVTLQTVTPGDMVYYVCKAENEYGTAATAIQLYRKCLNYSYTTLKSANTRGPFTRERN